MNEFHVGYGLFGIYAGLIKKNGTEWKSKTDVTKEAIDAVAGYLVLNDVEVRFTHKDKKYVMKVEECDADGQETLSTELERDSI